MSAATVPGGAAPAVARAPWRHVLLLVVAVGVVYANGLDAPFVFDDPFLVAERPDVALDYSTRPLVWATFDLNRALGGRDTRGYHAFNVLVHLGCGLLLLGLLRRTLALAAPGWTARARDGTALAATLLWLVHPLQTESVTYLSQRAESLGAFFVLAVLYASVRASASPRPAAWYGLAWAALALGFATKETIATAPVLVLLYDAVFLAGGPWAALRRRPRFYAGLFLLAAVLGAVFIGPLLRAERISAGFRLEEHGALEYARSQPGVILHYLRLAFWPHPLCLDYAWPIAAAPREWVPRTLVVAGLLGATIVLLARRSWYGYAGAFFFVALAPSSSVVPIRDVAVEHRMYLPLAAVVVLAVAGARALLARLGSPALRSAPSVAAVAAVVLGALTARRNRDYRSAEVLWRRTLEVAPHNARAHGNLGAAILADGRPAEALEPLMEALALDPDEGFVLLDLGKAHWRLGNLERAREFLERGVAREPDPRGLGALGSVRFELGDFAGASIAFREALAREPADPGAHYRLGSALAMLGKSAEALPHLEEAVRLAPDFQEARIDLATMLDAAGRTEEALAHSEAALALEPNGGVELFNHAILLLDLGRAGEAEDHLREACAAAPEMPEPRTKLAELRFARALELRGDGRFAEAAEALRESVRLSTGQPGPRAALAETLVIDPGATPAALEEALGEAERAVQLAQPARPELLAVLALVRGARGDFAGAVAALEQALLLPGVAEDEATAAALREHRDEYRRRAGG